MRTLLRNTRTGFYFQGVDNWSEKTGSAFDFKSTERAIRFLRDARLNARDLELILAFEDPRFNIRLPVDERFGAVVGTRNGQAPRVLAS